MTTANAPEKAIYVWLSIVICLV